MSALDSNLIAEERIVENSGTIRDEAWNCRQNLAKRAIFFVNGVAGSIIGIAYSNSYEMIAAFSAVYMASAGIAFNSVRKESKLYSDLSKEKEL